MRAKPLPRGGATRLRGGAAPKARLARFAKRAGLRPRLSVRRKQPASGEVRLNGRGRQVPATARVRTKFDRKGEFQFI